MASNDFLPFAVGGSANVITQSAYAALTSVTQNGFSAGIAQSNQLNKVWRQSSIMSAVLAQFIVDQSGQNAVDDGTTATLEANLVTAIRSAAVGRLINVQVLTSSGTYTRTPGATSGLVRIQGGGAGGAGSGVTGAGQVGLGSGGGSGAYGEHFYSGNLPATQAYTIGAGGTAGTISGGGGAGGTTTFGTLSAPGGGASTAPVVGTPPILVGANTVTVVATGCNLYNGNGKTGSYGIAIGAGGFISGAGGDSPFGGGAYPNVTGGAAGQPAVSRGAGGAGGSCGASSSGFIGGAGAAGLIIVYEFA